MGQNQSKQEQLNPSGPSEQEVSSKPVNSEKTALIIGSEELVQINISNKLHKKFEFKTRTFSTLQTGLDYMLEFKTQLVVIDLDNIDEEVLNRVYELVNYTQTPTVFISEDSNAVNNFKLPIKHPFISFLPKTVINTMFNDTLILLFKQNGIATKLGHRLQKVSTNKKPISFILLACLLLLEPVFKILFMKFSTGFDFETVFRTVFSIEGFITNFEFWAMFPLAGFALISEKSWSFLVFGLVQIYCVFSHFYYVEFAWPYVSESPHISASFLMFVNSAFILYFLVPENRRPYWNKSQKLWRNTSRYTTSLPTYFTHNTEKLYTTITDISASGAYFKSSENIALGQKTDLQFILDGKVQHVSAFIKRTHETAEKNTYGYGVSFENLTKLQKGLILEYINALDTRLQ